MEVSQIMSDAQKKDLETLLEEVLKSTNADKNYGAIKAGIGLIPGAGGAIAEFYSTYISPPAQKRLYLFLESLIKDLRKLEVQVRDFSLASLKENPCFTTMLIQSFDIAKRNHQEEKLEALRNLLLNSALPNSIEDDMKLLFLDWVDELKISHINLLYMLDDPSRYRDGYIDLPDLENNKHFYNQLLKHLAAKDLVVLEEKFGSSTQSFHKINQAENFLKKGDIKNALEIIFKKIEPDFENIESIVIDIKTWGRKPWGRGGGWTTDLGKLFLQFITSPLEDK